MSFSEKSTFESTESIAWREVDNQVVILHLKSGEYFTLNQIGQTIWKLAVEGNTLDQIKNTILNEYEVTSEQATNDLYEFINKMIQEGMLREGPSQ